MRFLFVSKGSEAPQTDKRSNLAGILIAVFLVIFLVIAAIFAFKYRARLVQKWRAFQQKAPGTKRYWSVALSDCFSLVYNIQQGV